MHAFLHSYIGATLVALFSLFVCRWVFSPLLARWNRWHGRSQGSRLYWGQEISLRAAIIGSFVGAYSHVMLDSIMHADIQPLAPFSSSNALYLLISVPMLHVWCLLSMLLGFVWLLHLLLIGAYRA